MDEQEKKKVDESYKAHIEKEREAGESAPQEEFSPPEANFSFFITTLGMQAAIALGDAANPQSNKKEENLSQAKFLIDTLGVLQDKTKNNLTKEENDILENILYELRLRYVEKSATGGEK